MLENHELLDKLKIDYEQKKDQIKARREEFKKVMSQGDEAIFLELCFCLFTAGSSARVGLACIEAIKVDNVYMTGIVNDISSKIERIHRFPYRRSEFVVYAREFFKQPPYDFKLKKIIESFHSKDQLRDFFVSNIKGLGYKEASHFLRNIGIDGYAILDRHILRNMRRFGLTNEEASPSSKIKYIEVEEKMKEFANQIDLDFDDLDLLFWSAETGEILK